MTKQTWGLNASLYDYYQAIAFREPDILKELRQATSQLPMANMQIAPEQGQFMALLVQLTGARKILEIGVFTGYSSLALALALPPQGRVLGCEISAEYAAIARQFWQKAGVSEKIDVLLGPAVTSLEQLLANGEQESFDLAFIDANKSDYDQYYELSLQLVRPGGLILIDNVLWYGKVADETVQDKATQSIRHLNAKLHQDPRISLCLVPIGDGLTLALKHHC
jgi:predicted O-methyltransferase YrrM